MYWRSQGKELTCVDLSVVMPAEAGIQQSPPLPCFTGGDYWIIRFRG
jgi:hypothetical protein